MYERWNCAGKEEEVNKRARSAGGVVWVAVSSRMTVMTFCRCTNTWHVTRRWPGNRWAVSAEGWKCGRSKILI
jgi:hypothetical protein